jgi:hypothetical protein
VTKHKSIHMHLDAAPDGVVAQAIDPVEVRHGDADLGHGNRSLWDTNGQVQNRLKSSVVVVNRLAVRTVRAR